MRELDTISIEELNERLKIMLSKEPHLEKINNETWYINPLTNEKRLIRDEAGNKINNIGV